MFKNRKIQILFATLALLLVGLGAYQIPFVKSRLAWRIDNAGAEISSLVNPPSEKVFVPLEGAQASVLPTPVVNIISLVPQATGEAPTQVLPTAQPTITPTPLPARVDLQGAKFYVDQKGRWNYCGPANVSMALKFWGWKGEPGRLEDLRDQVAMVVKPGVDDPSLSFIDRGRLDVNVMPYELENFVNEHTEYSSLIRHGGELNTLKALLAAGFPSVIEKGYYERDTQGKRTWMGHYLFVTGYDEAEQVFIVQDAFYRDEEAPRKDRRISYDELLEGWRSFNYLFMVVYPPERQNEVLNLLGNLGDPLWAYQRALQVAEEEILNLKDIDLYFAWFNKGTSHVQLQQYGEAATAYDRAFSVYASLGQDNVKRPYRMVWYQTGPYWAYFYTGRYQDVVNLADLTLSTSSFGPTLEESLYWRAMASYALGNYNAAYADMFETVRLNRNFAPGFQRLSEWGVQP